MAAETFDDDYRLQRSSRDSSDVPTRLTAWFSTQLPEGADPEVTLHAGIDANGMSSETLIFDLTHTVDGVRTTDKFVARCAPSPDDFPIFPHYDLPGQYAVMETIAQRSGVPIPTVSHLEPTGEVLGSPFFLMDRVDGEIPPDVMPYNFGDSWVSHASREQRADLQEATTQLLAELHTIPASAAPQLDPATQGFEGPTLLHRNVAKLRDFYEWAVLDTGRSELVERGLTWLEANIPETDDADAVLLWGDARIGNVIYRDFQPVAALDWEGATIGPRELDVVWTWAAHAFFETLTTLFEMPGLPDFLAPDDWFARYQEITGVELKNLDWYKVQATVAWGIVFLRTGARQIHFGEIEKPASPEELVRSALLSQAVYDEVGL